VPLFWRFRRLTGPSLYWTLMPALMPLCWSIIYLYSQGIEYCLQIIPSGATSLDIASAFPCRAPGLCSIFIGDDVEEHGDQDKLSNFNEPESDHSGESPVLKRGRKRNRPLPAKQKPRPPIQLNLESIREKQETDDILSKILKLYHLPIHLIYILHYRYCGLLS
jgi:hypothetical protein